MYGKGSCLRHLLHHSHVNCLDCSNSALISARFGEVSIWSLIYYDYLISITGNMSQGTGNNKQFLLGEPYFHIVCYIMPLIVYLRCSLDITGLCTDTVWGYGWFCLLRIFLTVSIVNGTGPGIWAKNNDGLGNGIYTPSLPFRFKTTKLVQKKLEIVNWI